MLQTVVHLAGCRQQTAGNNLQQSGFSAAIRTDDRVFSAVFKLKIHLFENPFKTIAFTDIFELNDHYLCVHTFNDTALGISDKLYYLIPQIGCGHFLFYFLQCLCRIETVVTKHIAIHILNQMN